MVSVALLITTCILGYFVMKICLAVIKACERAIAVVQAPERNTGEQRDQRVEQRTSNTSREVRGINSIEIPPARTHRNAYERRVGNSFFPSLIYNLTEFSINEPTKMVRVTCYVNSSRTFCVEDLFSCETNLGKKSLTAPDFSNGHRRAKIRTHNCRQKAKYLPPAPPRTRWTNSKWKSFVAV